LILSHLAIKTRIGDVWLASTPRGLFWVNLGSVDVEALESFYSERREIALRKGGPLVEKAGRELQYYLEGKLKRFSVKIDFTGHSAFSRRVWQAARKIPYGQVRPYAWIAERLRQPNSARAVGGALSRNPVPIFVPCHRVVGSHGELGGFSGGVGMKRWLLALESGQPSLDLDAGGVGEA
jgi:methylated-DNA-[protein]-cysteine S-methyltransferase